MSISGINFAGLASGLNTASIVQQLIAVDSQPMKQLQKEVSQLQTKQATINTVSSLVAGLQSAAAALNSNTGFAGVTASAADTTVATVSASSGAQTGSHSLTITQLAQAQRLAGSSLSSETNALGVSGQIVLNGKAIAVQSTDTLQTIASNINSAKVGITASIVSTTPNTYSLVLASSNTGTANQMSVADTGGGTILQSTLGLIGSGTSIAHAISGGADSSLFTDSATSIGTLLGLTAPPAGTIQINGSGVNIDLSTDSLSSIASKINAAGITGVSASVTSATNPSTGTTEQQLQISGATSFTDSNNILTNLGVLQNTPTNQVSQAKDAQFNLDGLAITRSGNTVTDVLSGVTLNLLKGSGANTTFSVSADTAGITTGIQNFVNSYNQLVNTVASQSTYDSQTQATGTLFGDVTIENLINQVETIAGGAVAGISSSQLNSLSQIGITLDQNGNLNINSATLATALSTNLQGVAQVFQAVGTATDSGVSYAGSSQSTQASSGSGYAVNITQPATQASVTAGTQHTVDTNPNTEILTFTGTQFGAGGATISIPQNSTLANIVAQINADPTVGAAIKASTTNNQLVLTAAGYGSAFNFTVSSSQSAANNNSGIGTTPLSGTGQDVAGTINGEAASGKGQFLTGNAGNANTAGLVLRITATTAGQHGTVAFSQGIAAQAQYFGQSETDVVTGVLTQYSSNIGQQVTDLNTQISTMQTQLNAEQSTLQQEFTNMETQIAQLQASSTALAAFGGGSSSGGSSSSSSSSGSSGSNSGTSSGH